MRGYYLVLLAIIGAAGLFINLVFIKSLENWQPVETRICQIKDWSNNERDHLWGEADCGGKTVKVYSIEVLTALIKRKTDTVSCTRSVSDIRGEDIEDCKLPD